MKKSFKVFLAVLVVFTLFGMTLPALAASYPSKAVVAIVPFGLEAAMISSFASLQNTYPLNSMDRRW